jgi:sulfide:quinone oxidoreductase
MIRKPLITNKTMKDVQIVTGKHVRSSKTRPYTAHHQILVIGGGTAGISVAALLKKRMTSSEVAVIEPSSDHYYQPLWTLSGVGVVDKEKTHRPMADVIPKGVVWIRDAATEFDPENNLVLTKNGDQHSYDYLVVAPGIQIDWDAVPGLAEGLGSNGICSIYSYRYVDYVNECVQSLQKGTALFTQPMGPFKCGGAPQKIMYMSGDTWRRAGYLKDIDIHFTSGGSVIFGVPEVAEELKKPLERYSVKTHFQHSLKEIKVEEKVAVYDIYENGKAVGESEFAFDMIHVTPPMSAPDIIKGSPIANAEGWVDVDKHTLQHVRYPNIFSLGDAGSTPE